MKTNLFNEMLGVLCVLFDKQLTQELITAYRHALRRFPEDELVKAGEILMDGDYFPRPGAFSKLLEPAKANPRDSANAAWSRVTHWAWEDGTPPDKMSLRAMRGVCDKYMLKRADDAEIRSYGFSFRANFEVLVVMEETKTNRAMIDGVKARRLEG